MQQRVVPVVALELPLSYGTITRNCDADRSLFGRATRRRVTGTAALMVMRYVEKTLKIIISMCHDGSATNMAGRTLHQHYSWAEPKI